MQLADRIITESSSFAYLVRSTKRATPVHAQLFSGPPISATSRAARIYATWLNCSHDDHTPCGQCRICKLASTQTHPFIHFVRPRGNELSIETIRQIIDQTTYKPAAGQVRVFIIEEADALGEEAANAFLKTLEEPPPRTVYLLVTERPDSLPQTITSRCMMLSFEVPSPETIIRHIPNLSEYEAARLYLGLLVTRGSLDLLDAPLELSNSAPTSLTDKMADYLDHHGVSQFFDSCDPFGAEISYPLAVFDWLVNSLLHTACSPQDAIVPALDLHDSHRSLERAITQFFQRGERNGADSRGKQTRKSGGHEAITSRLKRRSTTRHVLLVLDAIQVLVRLSVCRLKNGTLPLDLHEHMPALASFGVSCDFCLKLIRTAILSCRRGLFSNVSERILLSNLFFDLQTIFSISRDNVLCGHEHEYPGSAIDEGGSGIDA